MKRIFRVMAVAALFMSAAPAFGQVKIGHCNTDSLMVLMPEYTAAQTELANLKSQYEAELAEMEAEITRKANDLQANAATMTALRRDREEQDVQELYRKMQEFAQQAQVDLGNKEQELLIPILTKLQDAINKVGEAKGLDYVLDSSRRSGVVIFKRDTLSISNAVKAELGLL